MASHNISQPQPQTQAITHDDICRIIRELANRNGGLKALADKSGISYMALWGQMNRNAGVLAKTIPCIVAGSRSLALMQALGDGCGVAVSWDNDPAPINHLLCDLPASVGDAMRTIRDALDDGRITRGEYRQIHLALVGVNQVRLGLDKKIKSMEGRKG